MSQGIKAIYESMKVKQASLLALSGVLDESLDYDDYIDAVNSNSAVADHDHLMFQFAYHANQHEQLWDAFKEEMELLADSEEIGTEPWWGRVVSQFQVFDEPINVNGKTTYTTIDESKQIVKRVAVKANAAGRTVIKVAKESEPGVFAPLDEAEDNNEVGSLYAYLLRRQPFGTLFDLINLEPDKLRVIGNVFYDPVLDIDDVKEAVTASINRYLDELDFDGKIYVRKLTDYIQATKGVKDVSPVVIIGIAGSVTDTYDTVYEAASGYVIEDPIAKFVDTMTFEPFGNNLDEEE